MNLSEGSPLLAPSCRCGWAPICPLFFLPCRSLLPCTVCVCSCSVTVCVPITVPLCVDVCCMQTHCCRLLIFHSLKLPGFHFREADCLLRAAVALGVCGLAAVCLTVQPHKRERAHPKQCNRKRARTPACTQILSSGDHSYRVTAASHCCGALHAFSAASTTCIADST